MTAEERQKSMESVASAVVLAILQEHRGSSLETLADLIGRRWANHTLAALAQPHNDALREAIRSIEDLFIKYPVD